jgi:anti-sigma factor RsiW
MRCKNVNKHLTAFLDGELPNRLRGRLEAHLADCGNCRAERDTLERVRHAMDGMEAPEFTPSVSADAILERARAEIRDRDDFPGKRERSRVRPLLPEGVGWRPAIVLAAGLVVMVLWAVYPFFKSLPLPTDREMFIAERMELFENLELIEALPMVERLESIEG